MMGCENCANTRVSLNSRGYCDECVNAAYAAGRSGGVSESDSMTDDEMLALTKAYIRARRCEEGWNHLDGWPDDLLMRHMVDEAGDTPSTADDVLLYWRDFVKIRNQEVSKDETS